MTQPATATVSQEEIVRLRDLLTRREVNHHAGALLQSAYDLAQSAGQRTLARKQLNDLEQIAHAKGSVQQIVSFVSRQMTKQGSAPGWTADDFGRNLMARLGGRPGQADDSLEQHCKKIITAVQERLTLARPEGDAPTAIAITPEQAAAVTEKDRGYRADLHLTLARQYIGYLVGEYLLQHPEEGGRHGARPA